MKASSVDLMIFVLLSVRSGARRLFLVVSPVRASPIVFKLDSRAEPSLVIGGIDKGGTTDAWSVIKGETRIVTGSGTDNRPKELGCLLLPTPADAKLCYATAFSQQRAAERAANESMGDLPTMDATPSYLWGWRQPRDVPRMLSLVSPRAVAVFLLREPVARIKSLYNHWTRIVGPDGSRTPEHVNFGPRLDDHIRLELEYLESRGHHRYLWLLHNKPPFMHNYRAILEDFGLWLGSDLRRCANITGSKNKPKTTTTRARCNYFVSFVLTSVYASHLRHWMSYFAKRMLVVQSEAYFQRRDVLLSMLELPGHHRSDDHLLNNISVIPIANKGVYTDRSSSEPGSFSYELSSSVAARLAKFLVEPNARLRSLIETESRTGKIVVAPSVDSPGAWLWLGSDSRRPHV